MSTGGYWQSTDASPHRTMNGLKTVEFNHALPPVTRSARSSSTVRLDFVVSRCSSVLHLCFTSYTPATSSPGPTPRPNIAPDHSQSRLSSSFDVFLPACHPRRLDSARGQPSWEELGGRGGRLGLTWDGDVGACGRWALWHNAGFGTMQVIRQA